MQALLIERGRATALDEVPDGAPPAGFVWVDCVHDEGRAWVEPVRRLTGVTVYEDHLLDAENPSHPSFFDGTSDYEFIVFRGLAFKLPGSDEPGASGLPETDAATRFASRMPAPADPIRVRTRPTVFIVFPNCLVTVRAADSRTVPALRDRLFAAARAQQRTPDRPEDLMMRLLNAMVDRYLDLRQPLAHQLEHWQRLLLDPRQPFHDWFALLEARAELRKLEQLCEEQLDAVQEWRDERLERTPQAGVPGLGGMDDALSVRANDLVGHIHRVLNHARRMEQSAESAVQLHFSSTAHRTNEIMRTLTTITAIFMPLSLITGIFGMNFESIPGLHSPLGFWIAMGTMALVAAALLVFFRTRRYLSTSPRLRRRRRAPPA